MASYAESPPAPDDPTNGGSHICIKGKRPGPGIGAGGRGTDTGAAGRVQLNELAGANNTLAHGEVNTLRFNNYQTMVEGCRSRAFAARHAPHR